MSVIVTGMQMPVNCADCGIEFCVKWIYQDARKRPKDCPLRPLPEKHGRLIDGDVLLNQKGDCYDHDGHLLYAVGTGNILCAPTIVEAEGE